MPTEHRKQGAYGELPPAVSRGVHPFPFAQTIKGYGGSDSAGDLRAALNVALLAFPQGMAYALVAGLPIHYGIYGSAVAALAEAAEAPQGAGVGFVCELLPAPSDPVLPSANPSLRHATSPRFLRAAHTCRPGEAAMP